jgi:hypothetical protein
MAEELPSQSLERDYGSWPAPQRRVKDLVIISAGAMVEPEFQDRIEAC